MSLVVLLKYYPVRYVPAFLPGASFKKAALKARDALDEMSARPYEMVKQQRVGY